jgi:dynein heavy chain
MCVFIHATVRDLARQFAAELRRPTFVTPTSYLELLGTVRRMFAERTLHVATLRSRYENGVASLDATTAEVRTMETELTALQPVLVEKTAAADAMTIIITRDSAEAQTMRAAIGVERADAQQQADEAQRIKDECERDLAEVRWFYLIVDWKAERGGGGGGVGVAGA